VTAGPPFDFGNGTFTDVLFLSVARAADDFAVLWTGKRPDDTFQSSFVKLDIDGTLGAPVDITAADELHQINKLVATPNGFAALVMAGPPTFSPYLLLLDENGAVRGSAHRLMGAYFGWDLSVGDDAIGIVAARESGEPQFRPFDLDGEPLGPWVCLTGVTDISLPSAVDQNGDGWAVIYRDAQGAIQFSTFDRLGTGDPT
jgi:hypothetical protein